MNLETVKYHAKSTYKKHRMEPQIMQYTRDHQQHEEWERMHRDDHGGPSTEALAVAVRLPHRLVRYLYLSLWRNSA
jgi:hypothetical protein